MAGRQTLDLLVEVRILPSQPFLYMTGTKYPRKVGVQSGDT